MRKSLALALLVSFFTTMLPTFSASPPSFKQATADYNAGKFQVALIEFEKFRASYPTNLMVRYYEGLCYQGLNQLDSARTEFQYVIDNDDTGTLKGKAEAGIKTVSSADANTAPGTPRRFFLRGPEPGRLETVLEFLDKDLCKNCAAFAPHLHFVSTRATDVHFVRVIVDQDDDPRVPLYNPSKIHPWMVFLDGTPVTPKVLWKGITPPDPKKIMAQVNRFRVSRPTSNNLPTNTTQQNQNGQIPTPGPIAPGSPNNNPNAPYNVNPNVQYNTNPNIQY